MVVLKAVSHAMGKGSLRVTMKTPTAGTALGLFANATAFALVLTLKKGAGAHDEN